jgi:hypothetical protein
VHSGPPAGRCTAGDILRAVMADSPGLATATRGTRESLRCVHGFGPPAGSHGGDETGHEYGHDADVMDNIGHCAGADDDGNREYSDQRSESAKA